MRTNSPEPTEHVHRFIYQEPRVEICDQAYKGHNCRAIRVTEGKYQEILEEWDSYIHACRLSDAGEDFRLMSDAYKRNDKEEIKKILARVNTRCQMTTDDLGENHFTYTGDYMPNPRLPDPKSTRAFYVIA